MLTAGLFALRPWLDKSHIALAYLVLVIVGTANGGRGLGLVLAVTAFVLFNYFFMPPYGTLQVDNPVDWSILIVFALVSTLAAEMLHRLQQEAVTARQRTLEVNQVASLGAETLNAGRADDSLDAVGDAIRINLAVATCRIHRAGSAGFAADTLVAWVRQNDAVAIRFADETTHLGRPNEPVGELPPAPAVVTLLLPLRTREEVVGVLELEDNRGIRLTADQRRFLEALSYYAVLGIERIRLVAAAEHADALRASDRLKDALLASVSHDLRTPLTTIKALAHDLAFVDDRAMVIEQEADRLTRLVGDLLDQSRLQGGALPLQLALNAVDDLIGALLQRVHGLIGDRVVDVRFEGNSSFVLGRFDFVHALRILVNLVENAHKYSPIETPIAVEVRRDGDWIRIGIADRGPGVPADEREQIFHPFYRSPGSVPDTPGAGLGLSIARQLATLQGGSVTCADRIGGGSEFVLSLPAADLPAGAIETWDVS